MKTAEPTLLMSVQGRRFVPTNVGNDSGTASESDRSDERWREIIDRLLFDWGCNPSQLEDEGIDAPSLRTIEIALKLAQRLRSDEMPPPARVIPDPNGGIVFERIKDGVREVFRVTDQHWEFSSFSHLTLTSHTRLPLSLLGFSGLA